MHRFYMSALLISSLVVAACHSNTGLAPATLISKYIKDGAAQDIWWNVTDLGYLTYQTAQALAQCKITGKEGEKFTAGRLGEYTIGAGGELVLGPAKIVTPNNLAEFKF